MRDAIELLLDRLRVDSAHDAWVKKNGKVRSEDLWSANCTALKGACLRHGMLKDGDVLELGGVAIIYEAAV